MTKLFKLWNARRQTRNALYAMTDRELSDIGITRGNIQAIVDTVK